MHSPKADEVTDKADRRIRVPKPWPTITRQNTRFARILGALLAVQFVLGAFNNLFTGVGMLTAWLLAGGAAAWGTMRIEKYILDRGRIQR